ncbi:MAG TPA: hypothetical protein VMV37_13875, partial [Gammaproteobacteria bacterium]|nr:hypothetical protein [Gammaproteobacteria bacterium]
MLTIIVDKRRIRASFPTLLCWRTPGECMRYPRSAQARIAPLARELRCPSRINRSLRASMAVTNQALSGGYQLLNYRIDRQISRGGFSIVYRAFDETGVPVAIKEYLPSSLVLRTEGD